MKSKPFRFEFDEYMVGSKLWNAADLAQLFVKNPEVDDKFPWDKISKRLEKPIEEVKNQWCVIKVFETFG